jgi:V/A-type H+-transporting ATPase subunit E
VAIDDIVGKIAADAEAEGAALVAAAETDAARVVAEAKARADAERKRTLARESARAATEAETLLANARLRTRDAALTARLALAAEALSRAEAALVALPDAEYAALIASGVAGASTGREAVHVGAADATRLRTHLPVALAAAGTTAAIAEAPADVERGVVLIGGGVRVEVSPEALVAARRDELLAEADRLLSGREA